MKKQTTPAPAKPATPVAAEPALDAQVRRVLDAIRPAVQSDGGDVELVEVTSAGVVRVKFHGACVGCPSAAMTLKMGIERNLRQLVPQVSEVQAVN